MKNTPIIVENTLLGLSEGAGFLYLDLLDRYQGWANTDNERKAFLEATRYDTQCGGVLDYIITAYPGFSDVPESVKTSLKLFFKDRWKNNFMAQ